jgi:hypothetical protein
MTHSADVVDTVAGLRSEGLSVAEVSRRTGVARSTIKEWLDQDPAALAEERRSRPVGHAPGPCPWTERMDAVAPQYAYLLGLYLGDGCLTLCPRNVYRLRITLDLKYPNVIGEAYRAMGAVLPNRVTRVRCPGCLELSSNSLHWRCLFPQHGSGPKHLRPIVLEEWQERIALREHPEALLRGLIHSDGCRFQNRVKGGRYSYTRYMFTNESSDIKGIFCRACDLLGIDHRRANRKNISVARRRSVELLDTFVGPKR